MASRLGKYEILDTLGKGAMGVVYLARDPDLARQVALKVVKDYSGGSPEIRSRFLREARIVASLSHPHIVSTYELFLQDGEPCIVMEYLSGLALDGQVRGRAAGTIGDKVRSARHICQALAYAHERGVIHRDIKPSNIRFTGDSVAKLIDFGIARVDGTQTITETRALLGTPSYLAPELLRGASRDLRSDLYSFGVTLFEWLTYSRPFTGDSFEVVLARALSDRAPDVRTLLPDCPENLSAIVRQCLEKDPADRFQSARAVDAALREVESDLQTAAHADTLVRRRPTPQPPPPATPTPVAPPAPPHEPTEPAVPEDAEPAGAAPTVVHRKDRAADSEAARVPAQVAMAAAKADSSARVVAATTATAGTREPRQPPRFSVAAGPRQMQIFAAVAVLGLIVGAIGYLGQGSRDATTEGVTEPRSGVAPGAGIVGSPLPAPATSTVPERALSAPVPQTPTDRSTSPGSGTSKPAAGSSSRPTTPSAAPAAPTASLAIRTTPGAEISLNGTVRGTADRSGVLVIPGLEAGPFVVTARAPGKQAASVKVEAVPGRTEVFLSLADLPVFGEFLVRTVPGAVVTVNGVARGTADSAGELTISALTPASYSVAARADGKSPRTQEASAVGNKRVEISLPLDDLPRPPEPRAEKPSPPPTTSVKPPSAPPPVPAPPKPITFTFSYKGSAGVLSVTPNNVAFVLTSGFRVFSAPCSEIRRVRVTGEPTVLRVELREVVIDLLDGPYDQALNSILQVGCGRGR